MKTGGIDWRAPVALEGSSASFTSGDETCAEHVDWPAIPRTVVDAAHAIETALASPGARSAIESKIPLKVKGGYVAIRHQIVNGALVATAGYELTIGSIS